ncbi:hypothetical protein BVRB_033260, partial [Beta vulgaris subsp. vulgaris]
LICLLVQKLLTMYNDSPTTRPPIEKETTEKDPIPTKEHHPTTAENPTTRPPIEKETTEKDPIPTTEHYPTAAEK